MILSWSWFAQISQAWNQVQCTNGFSNATSCALYGLRCPEAQLCLQQFAFLSCPSSLPRLWDAITYLLRRGEQEWRARGLVRCDNLGTWWKDSCGEHRTQRQTPKLWGAGKLCLLVLSPPAPARIGAGVGGEVANAAWKHFNLLLESNRLSAAQDKTSSAAWKELMCSKMRALDANLWCLTSRQGRAWAPSVTGMSVWTEQR